MSEPIVLLLLRVPVQLINIVTTVAGTLFYAPSYLMFLLIQPLVFGDYSDTWLRYVVSWPLKFLALVISFTLFLAQFVYSVMFTLQHTDETSKYIIGASMAISIPGIIYLMRRGYLNALKFMKVPQLKSPKEFVTELVKLLGDIPNIVLAVLNILLIKQSFKTFDFQYKPFERTYLKHISKLVKTAIYFDLQRIFVWFLTIFPWRKKNSSDLIKQKDHNANRLAILFLLTFQTAQDIPVFILFGWLPFLSPYRSYKRYIQLLRNGKGTYRSYAFGYFFLTLAQYGCLLLNILAMLTGFQAKNAFENIENCFRYIPSLNKVDLKTVAGKEKLSWSNILIDTYQLELIFNGPFFLGLGLLQILLLGFRFIIWVSRYKQKKYQKFKEQKRNQLQQKQKQMRQNWRKMHSNQQDDERSPGNIQAKLYFECQKQVFKYAIQFILEIPFFPIAMLSGILKPWDFKYYLSIINQNYDVDIGRVVGNLIAVIFFYLAIIAFVVLLPLYAHRLRWLYNYVKNLKLQGDDVHHKLVLICGKVISQVVSDLPFIPLYYCMTASGTFLFQGFEEKKYTQNLDTKEIAIKYSDYMNEIIAMYYKLRVMISPKSFARFKEIYEKDQPIYIQNSIYHKRLFWKTAVATRRCESLTKLLKIYLIVTYLRKKTYERYLEKQNKRVEQISQELSLISKQYYRSEQILKGTITLCARVTIQIIIGLVTLLILLPLTSWRFPTLYFIMNDPKRSQQIGGFDSPRHVRLLHCIIFVLKEQLKDLAFLPVTITAFIFSPLRFIKYCFRYAYHYSNQMYDISFDNQLNQQRQYFFQVIWVQSFRNILSVVQLIGVGLTVVRIRWMIRLVNKAQHNFGKYLRRVLAINTDPTFQQWRAKRNVVKPASEKISLRMCIHLAFVEALKDIPFVFISLAILILFPWRFSYLWNVLKDQHQRLPTRMRNGYINVTGKRRDIISLMWSIIRTDFVCLILNTILIISVYKTKRGIQLAIKNFKRNLVVGFLSYDYKRELICQIRILIQDLGSLMKFTVVVIMLVRLRLTYIRLYRLYKENKQKEKMMKYSKAIYEETLKSGKEERLTTIGFYSFSKICDYLEPNDLHNMEMASKGLYIWTNQEEIWQNQWDKKYKALSQDPKLPLPYRELVTRSYKDQNRPKHVELTYRMIIDEEFNNSLHQPFLISDYVDAQKLTYPSWDPAHGFGGFRQLDEAEIAFHYAFASPMESILRVIIYLLRDPSNRILKQAIFTFTTLIFYICLIITIISNFSNIFSIGKFIAFKTMFIAHQIFFNLSFWMRIAHLRQETVPALQPYNFIFQVYDFFRSVAFKAGRKTQQFLIIAKDYIVVAATPLYKFIVKVVGQIKQGIVKIFEGITEAVKFVVRLVTDFFGAIIKIIVGLGSGYLQILAKTMRFFLKFGRLGDLVFTPIALAYLALPLILSYLFYWKGVAIVPAGVLTAVLYIRGYAVLKQAQR